MDEPPPRPGAETERHTVIHGWLPLAIGAVVLIAAIRADIVRPGCHWMMRSGSILTLLGGYVAYRSATVQIRETKAPGATRGILSVNYGLPYGWISLLLLIVGCAIWGYGDLFL